MSIARAFIERAKHAENDIRQMMVDGHRPDIEDLAYGYDAAVFDAQNDSLCDQLGIRHIFYAQTTSKAVYDKIWSANQISTQEDAKWAGHALRTADYERGTVHIIVTAAIQRGIAA